MAEFLPKRPEEALLNIKEILYERHLKIKNLYDENRKLIISNRFSAYEDKRELVAENVMMKSEMEFLENVLDLIERS